MGGGVFLGTTCMHLHISPCKHSGRRPTHLRALLRAPGRRDSRSRACSAPAGRPELSSPGAAYKGSLLWPRARKASVARFFPHPHEILGLISPCRRPWFSERVGQRPTTRAKVSFNALGEWAKGELGHSLDDGLQAACWAQSASFRALLLEREGARRRQNAAEARSCSWHPRLSQAVVLKEQ